MPASTIVQIKKRTGQIVEFNPDKILIAMSKAFAEVRGMAAPDLMRELTSQVMVRLEQKFVEAIPNVEDVQDMVETVLMEAGYFDVAKDYIIYRYEHAKVREVKKQEVEKKIETGGLYVIKRSGDKEPFSLEKVKRTLEFYIKGHEDVIHIDAVVEQVRREIYEDMPTTEIARSIIMVLRSFIEQDPAYSFVAAKALLADNYKTVVGPDVADFSKLHEQLRAAFVKNIKLGVTQGRLDARMLMFDLEELAQVMDFSRDEKFEYLGVQTLAEAYYLRIAFDQPVLETPQLFFMRIAMGLALIEKDRMGMAKKFYEIMSTFRYIPSSPTLYHAGTTHPQMSPCYLLTVQDDLTHIFKIYADCAQLSKWSGGIGHDWTNLRGTGALIKSTGVASQGTIPFLKIANDVTAAINRSGRRRGATCAYLETWHWDIEDFLELRKNTGGERRRTHDMDTSNWIPDVFMKRVREDGDWSLFSPDETPELHHIYGKTFEKKYEEYERLGETGQLRSYRKMKARDLWRKMLTMLFETGHPWMTWKDASNIRSPQDHVGVIHSSNLCTEITLNTSADETAVCNLGSVNLEEHVTSNGKLDLGLLQETVTLAMRMLDNVIDLNFYPTKEAQNSNLRHRPVGLGLMGFHYALFKMGIQFESEEAVMFADESMEAISYFAILASTQLARERGTYATYRGSKWHRGILPIDTVDLLEEERGVKINISRTGRMDWSVVREAIRMYGMRNSNCFAMAPTATISNIVGTSPTIEPIYKNIYVKSNKAGDFVVVNPYLVEDLKKLHLWDSEMVGKLKFADGRVTNIPEIPLELKAKYKEVFEIDAKHMVRVTAHRGKWIDMSQSFNIFYGGRSGKDLNDVYMYAWELGLKTTYYLRTLAVSQVEKSTVGTEKYGDTHKRSYSGSADVSPSPTTKVQEAVVAATSTSVATATMTATVTDVLIAPVTQPQPAATAEPKLCKINDPDCEACQ